MRRVLRIALLTTTSSLLMLGVVAPDAAAQPACTAPKTTCVGSDGYYASAEDLSRVTAVTDPLLKELRTCLDAAGGKHITPTFVVRWDSEGNAVSVKVDVPGYETQPCVAKIQAKLQKLQNPHETSIRCEYGCGKPASSTPPPPVVTPPVVVPPPSTSTTTTPPPATPPATTPPPTTPTAPAAWHSEKVWYGWQTLIVDGVSVVLMGVGVGANSGAVGWPGYLTFLLGAPVVHFTHGNIGPGFGSGVIRFFGPPLAAGIGGLFGLIAGSKTTTTGTNAVDRTSNRILDMETGATKGLVIGWFVGVLGCAAIDAAGLSYERVKVDGPAPQGKLRDRDQHDEMKKQAQWYTLAPNINIQKDQASLGVSGSF